MTKLPLQIEQLNQAIKRLEEVLAVPKTTIVRDSAIKRFELTLDLSWKTIKKFLDEKHKIICNSPRSCFKEAYSQSIISYDDQWIKLVDMRNEAVHTYNEQFAEEIYKDLPAALKLFQELLEKLKLGN